MRRRGTTTRGLGARRLGALVAGLVVGLGGLAACDGGADPAPTVTRTPVESSSPEPTPPPTPTPVDPAAVPPERPAAMDTVDEAGAEAVARYFLDLYAYVYATGDLEAWRELSHPECVFCASVITNVEEQVAAGHRSEGGEVDVETMEVIGLVDGHFSVTATIGQAVSTEYDGEGNVVSTSSGDPALVTFAIWNADTGLKVREVQVDPVRP